MLSQITDMAKSLGFIGIGFSRPGKPPHLDKFRTWISERRNADMTWLERNMGLREDPSGLLQDCRTIISLAYPYSFLKPVTADNFSVSRYCQPPEVDYHYRLKRFCRELADMIHENFNGSRSRICVDSAPILERSLAYSSGIGFIGKNNMLIISGYGSYLYLAEILTTAYLDFPAVEVMEEQCGSCTLCVDSCPTGALESPFSLDASRCLSYLTIEHKDAINEIYGRKMGNNFFGCDNCQEVCPHNRGEGSLKLSLPSTEEFLSMSDGKFRENFGKTAFARAGLEKIKTNIRAIKSIKKRD